MKVPESSDLDNKTFPLNNIFHSLTWLVSTTMTQSGYGRKLSLQIDLNWNARRHLSNQRGGGIREVSLGPGKRETCAARDSRLSIWICRVHACILSSQCGMASRKFIVTKLTRTWEFFSMVNFVFTIDWVHSHGRDWQSSHEWHDYSPSI